MPENLLCSISNSISWTEDRNGGWIYIPFVSENIILNPLSTYYVEIDYNGSELINTFPCFY